MAEILNSYPSLGAAQANLQWNSCAVEDARGARKVTFASDQGMVATFTINPDGSLARV